jgi:hypothetical protein
MMAPPCSFPICRPQATATRDSASLTTARIGRVADETTDCRTRCSTDTNAEPGSCQGTARNTADSTADGRARNCPFRSGAGGCTAGKGDDSPDHKKFTHHSNSTDGSPAIQTVSTQFVKI